jgi:hypothetical protein
LTGWTQTDQNWHNVPATIRARVSHNEVLGLRDGIRLLLSASRPQQQHQNAAQKKEKSSTR